MKNLYIASILFYTFIILNIVPFDIQNQTTAIIGLLSFFASILTFIIIISFYSVILFDKKFSTIHLYVNVNVTFNIIALFGSVIFKNEIYKLGSSTSLLYGLILICFIGTIYGFVKIFKFIRKKNYSLVGSVSAFLMKGSELEETEIFKAVTVLDRYLLLFSLVSVLITELYIYLSIVGLIVILTIKSNKIVYHWTKVNFSNSYKAKLSMIIFYASYILAVCTWYLFENRLAAIFIASLSMLAIKINYNKVIMEIKERNAQR